MTYQFNKEKSNRMRKKLLSFDLSNISTGFGELPKGRGEGLQVRILSC